MAKRILVLVGNGTGPRSRTDRFRQPRVKAVGISGKLVITHDAGQTIIEADGFHEVPESVYVQASHDGNKPGFMCFIEEAVCRTSH